MSGLSYNRMTFLTGLIYIIGRELYSQGYRRSGSKGRLVGALIIDLTLLILWSMASYTCFYWGNGFKKLIYLFILNLAFFIK
jgi:ABC-type multidrug transport system permease subunit